MDYVVELFRNCLTQLCIVGFCLTMAVLLFCKLAPLWSVLWKKWLHLDGFGKCLTVLAVVFFTLYGGSKTLFKFDDGLYDDHSYATNDTLHVAWTRDPVIPLDSTLYIDYRTSGATNEEWITLGVTTVGAFSFDAIVQNATNFDYFIWSEYVPPTPIHTNGVWCGYGEFTRDGKMRYLSLNSKIVNDKGETVAMPNHVRNEKKQEDDK